MKHRARFIGGSLGGRELDISNPTRVYVVPVSYPRIGQWHETDTAPLPRVKTDEYQREGRDGFGVITYRWRRPDVEGMQAKIALLTERLAELEKPEPRRGLMRFGRRT